MTSYVKMWATRQKTNQHSWSRFHKIVIATFCTLLTMLAPLFDLNAFETRALLKCPAWIVPFHDHSMKISLCLWVCLAYVDLGWVLAGCSAGCEWIHLPPFPPPFSYLWSSNFTLPAFLLCFLFIVPRVSGTTNKKFVKWKKKWDSKRPME